MSDAADKIEQLQQLVELNKSQVADLSDLLEKAEQRVSELETMRRDIKFLAQWIVDLDQGKFIDANDYEYNNGVGEAKAHLAKQPPEGGE